MNKFFSIPGQVSSCIDNAAPPNFSENIKNILEGDVSNLYGDVYYIPAEISHLAGDLMFLN